MKIAVIGCGGIGAAHARAYRAVAPDTDLLCLDVDPARAAALAGQVGGHAGKYPDDLPPDLAGASVTTPPDCHAEPVRRLLAAGVPVFCEKPLTTCVQAGAELVALAQQRNVPLLVGFKMRFEPVFCRAREVLPGLGRLYAVSGVKCQPYRARPGRDWIPEIGALFELASHDLDLVHWLAGLRPVSVAARLERNPGWTAETRFRLQIEYAGGVGGQFMGGYVEQTGFCYRDIALTFLGENGYLRIERPDRIVCHFKDLNVVQLDRPDTNTFPAEVANFLAVIRGAAAPFVTPEEAHRVTCLVLAARESADRCNGAPVAVA